jgi:hypothetical protein
MKRVKVIIEKYLPFAWWVLMALLMVCGVVAGAKAGGFFGVSAIIGCIIAAAVFAWQAWGEWLEIDQADDQADDQVTK